MSRPPRPAGPPPDPDTLHEAALAHLARYAATEAGLRRVLERRVARWARAAEAEHGGAEMVAPLLAEARAAVRTVVARLAAAGAVNDAAYAEARARSLTRAGRSRRAVAAHLAAKGIASETARAVLPDDAASELAAALILARRRRLGPFRAAPPPDGEAARRELAILARAGFPQAVATRALGLDRATAEDMIAQLQRG